MREAIATICSPENGVPESAFARRATAVAAVADPPSPEDLIPAARFDTSKRTPLRPKTSAIFKSQSSGVWGTCPATWMCWYPKSFEVTPILPASSGCASTIHPVLIVIAMVLGSDWLHDAEGSSESASLPVGSCQNASWNSRKSSVEPGPSIRLYAVILGTAPRCASSFRDAEISRTSDPFFLASCTQHSTASRWCWGWRSGCDYSIRMADPPNDPSSP